MNSHMLTLVGAFFAGTAATAGLVRLMKWAPIPEAMKVVLALVIPVPPILIGWALAAAGSDPARGAPADGSADPRAAWALALYGGAAMLAWTGLEWLWRRAQAPDMPSAPTPGPPAGPSDPSQPKDFS